MKLSIEQQENLEELAKLSGIYKRKTDYLVRGLNLWRGVSGKPNEFSMLFRKMIEAFPKSQIKLVKGKLTGHPYEAIVNIHGMTISALVSSEEFRQYYPEKIEDEIANLEKELMEYRRLQHATS